MKTMGTAPTRPETLGSWLDIQMKKTNLTEKRLAIKAGIGDSAIRKWVQDRNYPKLEGLIAICEVFGNEQTRRPSQLLFEALQHIPEMRYADTRWNRKQSK